MNKRKDYSKESKKSKKPSSIRCNVQDLEAAMEISGRKTVQSLVDYLLAKFLADHGRHLVAPIDAIDARPIDKRVFDVSGDKPFKPIQKMTKEWLDAVQIGQTNEPPDIAKMEMWKPNTKPEKIATKAATEKFAADEMKRLKEMQERAAKLKGKKK